MMRFLFQNKTKIQNDQAKKNKDNAYQRKIFEKAKEAALKERERIIAQSRLDSENILKGAERMKERIIAEARLEAQHIIQQGREEILKEKEKLRSDMTLQFDETGRMEMLLNKVYQGQRIL
ncbi:MAG: hypothetical protein ACMUIP_06880 [bacterium]